MNIDLGRTQIYLDWFKQKLYYDWKANNSKDKNIRVVKRNQVYYCDLGLGIGSEETKNRPCVIIQNDTGNQHSPNTIVAPITNEKGEGKVSVLVTGDYEYIDLEGQKQKLSGYILLGNIVTVSKARLGSFVTTLVDELDEMNGKILTSLGLYKDFKLLQDKVKKDKIFIRKSIDVNYKLKNIVGELIRENKSEIINDLLAKNNFSKTDFTVEK